MRRGAYLKTICAVVVAAVVLIASVSAFAQTPMQMTALEKNLYQAALKEGKLVYWDSLNLKEATVIIKAFTDRYPGVEVSYWSATDTGIDEKYFAEAQAGKKPADVMNVGWYGKYKKEGLLVDLKDIINDSGFPKEFATRDLDSVSPEHTVKGLAYNTNMVSPTEVPRAWEDLLNPKWKGKVSVEPTMDLFTHITKPWGEEKTMDYLKKLRKQNPFFHKGVSATMTLLGAGEFPIAMEAHLHSTLSMQKKGTPIAFAPISPLVVKTTPFVTVREAPHPNAAKLYIRWIISPEGQAMVDKVRNKGNPLPGAGTSQSRAVEQLGVKLAPVSTWDLDYDRLQRLCWEAVGYTK